MTTFEQALHIFRKDARHLRLEIAGIFMLLLVLVLTGVQTWEGLQRRGGPAFGSESPLSVLLAVAWSLLIARAIQTEALPGDRHFWLTRPYSRAGLVLAKALFIGSFINLPFLVVQAAIVSLDGLPLFSNIAGLLWNQVLISVLILLPVAAIAALTRNLAQFVPAVVLTTALLIVPVGDHRTMGDREWIRSSVGLSLAAAITVLALWRQYRLRRPGNTALLAAGATAVGVVLYLSFPQSVAFAIQSRLIGGADGQFALRLAKAGARKVETKTPNRYQQALALPIAVAGANAEDLRIESSKITFKTLSGITRQPWARADKVEHELILKTSLDRNFFEAAKNSPVTVLAEFYLTQFGTARSADVSLDGTPLYISGLGQCGVMANYDQRMFVCRSAFRGPQLFLSERVARGDRENMYSPFPAQPHIYPVVARTYRLVGGAADELAPATPERPATLLVRAPVAHFRYTMESANVRLGDYAITEPDDDAER